jgi:steroid 5-alpha reductase family enzyme
VSSFAVHPFLTGLALSFGVALVVFVVSWLMAVAVGRYNIVDVVWGLSFVAIAVTSFAWSAGHGQEWRRILVLVLDGPNRALRALGMVFVLQAVVAWFISLPVQAAMYIRSGWTFLAWIGVAVWAIGLFFEAVGDAQMGAFRKDPANKGQVMDRGLWRYSRHPNYFGDATVWAGLFLIAAEHWVGALTVFSPVLMGWFLSFKTGKPLLERHMAKSKPGYADYMKRTSGFFPLPPKPAK